MTIQASLILNHLIQFCLELAEFDIVTGLDSEDGAAEDKQLTDDAHCRCVNLSRGSMKKRHTHAMRTPSLKLAMAMVPCRRVSCIFFSLDIIQIGKYRFGLC